MRYWQSFGVAYYAFFDPWTGCMIASVSVFQNFTDTPAMPVAPCELTPGITS